ncbi:MAG: glycoside hydrolase family 97 catalytic domain-containing protein, partial [Bacteroidota bacterium]|nr:glycoside hydrolase family 97 catalytic domain-containing protein [Bacteroidota bacterium]
CNRWHEFNSPKPIAMKKLYLLLNFAVALLFSLCAYGEGETMIQSPDGNINFYVFLQGKQLSYSVTFNKRQVIEPSPMIMTVDDENITQLYSIGKNENFKVNETYPWLGLNSKAINHFNGKRIALRSIKGTEYYLEVRVFNDAVAFQFEVPGIMNAIRTPDEATVFTLPAGSTAWYHDLNMHYEGVHTKKLVDTIPAGQWAAPVVTAKLPEGAGYAAITEADLKNYAGMALQTNGNHGFVLKLAHNQPASYPYVLRYSKEDVAKLSQIASIIGTITTPWRVVLVGADLNKLVNSDAIHNLCPPADSTLFPQGIKTAWIKPGRAVWKYLDGGGDGTVENMKKFSKEAAELGFEHNVLEGFWSRWSDDSIRDLVKYSNDRNVGLFVWTHSKNLRDSVVRHQLFQRCHDLGITGLKIDFFDNEGEPTINLYNTIAREAAEKHLLLIFHGANKPTGLQRTWPNIMIYEAVKGMEASKLTDRATHETTLPFTRMLAGPADYSVVHFGDRRKNTTWAHQIATAAIFSAPLITYAASPENILTNPAVDMIKSIPSTWDETKVLPPSEIGELAIYAQRKGNTWFLSVINGVTPRSLKIPLSFLSSGSYQVMTVSDDKNNPAAVKIENKQMKRNEEVTLDLGVGGGFIGRFTKK